MSRDKNKPAIVARQAGSVIAKSSELVHNSTLKLTVTLDLVNHNVEGIYHSVACHNNAMVGHTLVEEILATRRCG